jgi:gamma-D-glutamyl-L-lysine dipeptidyl-peptidase
MDKYICGNVFVPLRSGPSHRAEMLSQVLFGEKYEVVDHIGHWLKVKTCFDDFEGWLDGDHIQHYPSPGESCGHVLNKPLSCQKSDGSGIVLEPGCEIFTPDFEDKTFMAGNELFKTGRDFGNSYITTSDSLADTAMKFINSPYIWGGRIPSGIDCSGLTQLVYKIHGIAIPRNSFQQAEKGTEITFIDDSRPGDLVFFDDDKGRITHVGMILSRGLVIHGSGRVRIDAIDHQGIFKQEIGTYSHHLRVIKRLLP